MTTTTHECPGCNVRVRISDDEIESILAAQTGDRANDALASQRLAICRACDDLLYGSTCRHCGCLVAARTRLRDKQCPRPGEAKWAAHYS